MGFKRLKNRLKNRHKAEGGRLKGEKLAEPFPLLLPELISLPFSRGG
jgi:hypothetical protein